MNDLDTAKLFVTGLTLLTMAPDELAHYGTLGMKWGRRKDADGNYSTKVKQPRKVKLEGSKKSYRPSSSKDYVESRELLTKKKYELSNAEIDRIVNRIQKEQKLSKVEPSKINQGKKTVAAVIGVAGTAGTLYGISQSPHGKAAIKYGKTVIKKLLK